MRTSSGSSMAPSRLKPLPPGFHVGAGSALAAKRVGRHVDRPKQLLLHRLHHRPATYGVNRQPIHVDVQRRLVTALQQLGQIPFGTGRA